MDLDQVRLKTTSQLNEDEREFLKKNIDKLTDEDKEAYATFLQVDETPNEETPAGEEAAAGSETPGEGETTVTPAAPVVPQETPFSFKSEDEAKDFVRKQSEDNERAKQAAIDAAATPEEKKYVEDNWKPENWNKGIGTIKDIVKKELREEAEAERVETEGKRLAKEWEDLSKEKNIPALTTAAGRVIHDSVVRFGLAAGKTTFKDAYEVWSKVPKEYGGGLEVAVAAVVDPENKGGEGEGETKVVTPTPEAQRKAAAKIGGQNAGAGSVKGAASLKPITYEDLKKPQAKLIREGLHG